MEPCVEKMPLLSWTTWDAKWGLELRLICGRKNSFVALSYLLRSEFRPLVEWMKDNEIKDIKGHIKMG